MSLQYKKFNTKVASMASSRVQLAPVQLEIIAEIAEIIAEKIGMKPMAVRGFILFALKDWQQKHNGKVSDLVNATPNMRLRVIREMFDILNNRLKRVLLIKRGEDRNKKEKMLKEALDESYKLYVEKFESIA